MPAGRPDTTTPQRLRRRGGWLLYLAVLTCPVGKLVILAVAGSAFGVTLDNPWIVGGALLSVLAGVVLLVRRAVRGSAGRNDAHAGGEGGGVVGGQ